jgi:ankyrin repeat protein
VEWWRCVLSFQADFVSQHQFVEYAATHWIAHFKASNATEEDEISADATGLCFIRPEDNTWRGLSHKHVPSSYLGLLVAARYDLIQVLKILLSRGEDIGQVEDKRRETALHVAIANENLRAAKVIIELNAPINAQNNHGNTPLHVAIYSDSVGIVRLLLSRGAEVQLCNNKGRTALHNAAKYGSLDIERALIKAGANVNALDKDLQSPLHLAATTLDTTGIYYKSIPLSTRKNIIDILIENGADPSLVDGNGKTAMQLARDDEFEYLFKGLGLSRE